MIDISKALAIDGWMEKEELTWLAEQASTHKVIAEIGSWIGRSTRAIADNTRGVVFAVDTWTGAIEHQAGLLYSQRKRKDIITKFHENMEDLIGRKVFPMNMPSVVAAAILAPKFDMVFIDGAHDYQSVSEDIQNWSKLLKPDGLLCGHDYNPDWPQVVSAVKNNVPEVKKVPRTDIWFYEYSPMEQLV